MVTYNRLAWQAASAINDQLQSQPAATIELPQELWLGVELLLRKINKANQRGWHLAAKQMRLRYLPSLERLRLSVSQVHLEMESAMKPPFLTPLELIYKDLCSLAGEFDEVEISLSQKQLKCRTPEIELEGIQLGRFSIALNWSQLNENQPYQVEALEPNPAASSDSTTHPHLQDGRLCEGDGKTAIQAALQQGRICDFFLLVRQILGTYNPDSPYVSLDKWFGANCKDCDYLMDRGDSYCCRECDYEICSECSCCCQKCYETVCNQCSRTCEDCLDSFCPGCIDQCPTCEKSYCKECLKDEICKSCLEEQAEIEEETEQPDEIGTQATETENQSTDRSHVAVHAVCVGETPVSA